MSKYTHQPFLGTTTNVNDAFPGIDKIDITIEQDPYGYYCQHEWQRVSRYTKASLPRHLQCINPKCQQGGLDLQSFVLFNENGEFDFSCNGHEGSPKGRRKGDPCDNRIKIKLTIERTK